MPIDPGGSLYGMGARDPRVNPPQKKIGVAKPVQRRSSTSTSSRGYSSRGTSGGYSSRSSGGGGSSSGGGGGGGGGISGAPSIGNYLGTDSVYQQAVRGGKRTLTDFLSDMTRRRGEAGTQFNETKGSMERDRTQQLDDLKNEFASRGLIQSGLYGDEQGKFQQKFTDQMTALQQQQASLLADLLSQQTNFTRENGLTLEQAKQEALLRRSQKYGIQ